MTGNDGTVAPFVIPVFPSLVIPVLPSLVIPVLPSPVIPAKAGIQATASPGTGRAEAAAGIKQQVPAINRVIGGFPISKIDRAHKPAVARDRVRPAGSCATKGGHVRPRVVACDPVARRTHPRCPQHAASR